MGAAAGNPRAEFVCVRTRRVVRFGNLADDNNSGAMQSLGTGVDKLSHDMSCVAAQYT